MAAKNVGFPQQEGGVNVGRAFFLERLADVAQLVERVLGKDEVTGPIPVIGSMALMEAGVTQW